MFMIMVLLFLVSFAISLVLLIIYSICILETVDRLINYTA